MKRLLITIFLAMVPTIITVSLLIEFFPYTGLGRIVSIPSTFFINFTIVLIGLLMTHKLKSIILKSLVWIAVIFISIFLGIAMHPQEYLPGVLTQIREMIF